MTVVHYRHRDDTCYGGDLNPDGSYIKFLCRSMSETAFKHRGTDTWMFSNGNMETTGKPPPSDFYKCEACILIFSVDPNLAMEKY